MNGCCSGVLEAPSSLGSPHSGQRHDEPDLGNIELGLH